MANTEGVDVSASWQGAKGFFSGQGLILLKATGYGDLFFNSYGAVMELARDRRTDRRHRLRRLLRRHGELSSHRAPRPAMGSMIKSFFFGAEGSFKPLSGPRGARVGANPQRLAILELGRSLPPREEQRLTPRDAAFNGARGALVFSAGRRRLSPTLPRPPRPRLGRRLRSRGCHATPAVLHQPHPGRLLPSSDDHSRMRSCIVTRPRHLNRADALLFGRVTYEMMEAAWRRPADGHDGPTGWRGIPFARDHRRGEEVRRVEHAGPGRLECGAGARATWRQAVQRLKQEPGKGLFVGGVTLPLALGGSGIDRRVRVPRAAQVCRPRADVVRRSVEAST